MALTMMYSCGLRVSEATHLQVTDIDSARMVVRVQGGKGNRDRHVPLPRPTLEALRTTFVYLQLTPSILKAVHACVNDLTAGLVGPTGG